MPRLPPVYRLRSAGAIALRLLERQSGPRAGVSSGALVRIGSGRWYGAVFGAKISHQLGCFLVGYRVAERRHLLTAVEDLIGDLSRGPLLVLAQVDERRSFLGADAVDAMAMSAAFVAKQDGAGFFGGLGSRFTSGPKEILSVECDEKHDSWQQG